MGLWNSASDRDYDDWLHEYDEPRSSRDEAPVIERTADPIVPSACTVCRAPIKRAGTICAACRVVA
jgi:hypothetical protein